MNNLNKSPRIWLLAGIPAIFIGMCAFACIFVVLLRSIASPTPSDHVGPYSDDTDYSFQEPAINDGRNVIVNGQRLDDDTLRSIEAGQAGAAIPDGAYWYDPIAGLWGLSGQPIAGWSIPGLPIGGYLAADASNGDSNVFLNGRELPVEELLLWQQVVPINYTGRYALDSQGYFGFEDGPIIANLWESAANTSPSSSGSILSTYDKAGGALIGNDFLSEP